MNKLVSVVVPVFNNGSTVEDCLNSILKQSYTNIEVIVVNDGSTDNSLEICNRFSVDGRVIIVDSIHHGVSGARNMALRRVRGEYIMFCDADDKLMPNAILQMLRAFPKRDLVIGNVLKKNAPEYARSITISKERAISLFFSTKQNRIVGTVYGKMFKKDIVSDTLFFDNELSIGEDALFLLMYLFRCNRIKLIDSFVYHHVDNLCGIIASKNEKQYQSALLASKKMVDYIILNTNQSHLTEAVQDMFNVYFRIIERINNICFGAELFSTLISYINQVGAAVIVVNVGLVCYTSLSFKNTSFHIGVRNKKNKVVIQWPKHYVLVPALINMHIHMGDYSTGIIKEYCCTEDFLKNKDVDDNYYTNLGRNLSDGISEGVLTYVHSHKRIKNTECYEVIRLCSNVDVVNVNESYGFMIRNLCDDSLSNILNLFRFAKAKDYPVFLHISSSKEQDSKERKQFGGSVVQYLYSKNLLGDSVFFVHGSYLNPQELEIIRKTKVNIVVCPVAEEKLHENILSIDSLERIGINWFIGTDSQAVTGSSSIIENAEWVKKHTSVPLNKVVDVISRKPIFMSMKWVKPLKQKYLITSKCEVEKILDRIINKRATYFGVSCVDGAMVMVENKNKENEQNI